MRSIFKYVGIIAFFLPGMIWTQQVLSEETADGRMEACLRKDLIGAYDTIGSRSPKWDALAHKVLELAIRRWLARPFPDDDIDWQIMILGDRAVAVGCNDPAVLYFDMRAHAAQNIPVHRVILERLSQSIFDSGYASFLKMYASLALVNYFMAEPQIPPNRQRVERLFQSFGDNLAQSVAQPECSQEGIADACADLTRLYMGYEGDRKPMVDKLYHILIQATPKNSPLPDFYAGLAWWTHSADRKDILQNDRRALQFFSSAIAKDPHSAAKAPMIGLLIDLGYGYDSPRLKECFDEAIADDPNSYWAYFYRACSFNTGRPDSVEDLLAFGRHCLLTQRWKSKIPFLLLKCQEMVVLPYDDADGLGTSRLFHAIPQTWTDVQTLYELYLVQNPKAVAERIDYAKRALWAEHPEIAIRLMDQLDAIQDPDLRLVISEEVPHSHVDVALATYGLRMLAEGNPKQALLDLQGFAKVTWPQSPFLWYSRIWIWMAQAQIGDKARADQELLDFASAQNIPHDSDWPPKIAAYLLDQISEDEFLRAAGKDPGKYCEANYYAGRKHLLAGDKQTAANFFRKCIATEKTEYLEYIAARQELKALNSPVESN